MSYKGKAEFILDFLMACERTDAISQISTNLTDLGVRWRAN
jgi:hypothetical protein